MLDWFTITLVVVLLLLIPTGYAGLIGAPYAPTWRKIIRKGLKAIELNADDVLIDLGAGDGNVLLVASELGAKAVGYELSPIMWAVAWARTLFRKNISVRYGNFFKKKFPEATVIWIFLMPKHMGQMRTFLSGQNLPQAKYVFAYAFPFPGFQPLQMIQEEKCAPLYLYRYQDLKLEN